MKRRIFNFQWLWVGLVLVGTLPIQAAEVSQPFFKMALKSYNQFFDDMRQIGQIASDPAFATTVELPLQIYFGADLLESLDKDAPLGFSLQKVDEGYEPLVAFPLDDATILSDFIAGKNPEADVAEQENGVIVVTGGLGDLFLKTVGDWTYVALNEAVFQNIPEKNEDFFAAMEGTFTLQFDMRLLPQDVKDMILRAFSEGADLAEDTELPESLLETRKKQIELTKKSFQMIFDTYSLSTLELGMNEAGKSLELKCDIQLIPGCSMDKMLQKTKTIPARFTGFANMEWVLGGYGVSTLDEEMQQLQKENVENTLNTLREAFRLAPDTGVAEFFTRNEALFSQILEILKPLESLCDQEEIQTGFGIRFEPKNTNAILAFSAEDPALVETTFQKLIALAKEKAGDKFKEEWVKYDVQTLQEIRFHQLKLTLDDILAWIPEEDAPTEEELAAFQEVAGDSWELVLGLGKDSVYLAIGNQPIPLIEQTLAPAEKAYPAYISISLYQIFDYYSQTLPKDGANSKTTSLLQIMKEILAGCEANQCVITSEYTENGVRSRVILQEGVTRLIGSLRSIATIMAM